MGGSDGLWLNRVKADRRASLTSFGHHQKKNALPTLAPNRKSSQNTKPLSEASPIPSNEKAKFMMARAVKLFQPRSATPVPLGGAFTIRLVGPLPTRKVGLSM